MKSLTHTPHVVKPLLSHLLVALEGDIAEHAIGACALAW